MVASNDRKPKGPPKFQHLPVHQAKKLKQAWVEKAKIKSKWRSQKRKEGLIAPTTADMVTKDDVDEEQLAGPSTKPRKSHIHPSRAHLHPEPIPDKKADVPEAKDVDDGPTNTASLRALTAQAYSRSTLHTYKSDPLNKRRHREASDKGVGGRTGRGQPNMKLRMGALLEKIKQDYTK